MIKKLLLLSLSLSTNSITATRDVNITITTSWNCRFRGHSIITHTLDLVGSSCCPVAQCHLALSHKRFLLAQYLTRPVSNNLSRILTKFFLCFSLTVYALKCTTKCCAPTAGTSCSISCTPPGKRLVTSCRYTTNHSEKHRWVWAIY